MDLIGRSARSFGVRNRTRKLEFARQFVATRQIKSVLFVGVSADHTDSYSNLIETQLQHEVDVAVATGLGAPLEVASKWRDYRFANALDLPFENQSFDLVYSNAVIEHVGDKTAQQTFVNEHARVGKHFILTTPNRMFPIEAHRHVLFAHWSRSWVDPAGSVSRLVSKRDLVDLLPPGSKIRGSSFAPTLTGYR